MPLTEPTELSEFLLMRILEKEDSHQPLTRCVFEMNLPISAYLPTVQIELPKADCFA